MEKDIIKVIKKAIPVCLCLMTMWVSAQPSKDDLYLYDKVQTITEDNIFKTEGYYNWGASIHQDKRGIYHLFYSRWKKEYTFTGWLTHSEVAHATSKSSAGPWKYKETVLQGRGKGYWDAITAHNPKIKYFEGKYYLYYISTNMGNQGISDKELLATAQTGYKHPNWQLLRPNQRTGVAVSTSINGPWKRMDKPLIEPSGPITTLTVNPAIDRSKDGKYYLVVKGDKPNTTHFVRNQAIAVSDSPAGPFEMREKPVIDYMDTEDMSIWFDKTRERFYGVFHAHTFIGLVTSQDGINWKMANDHVLMLKSIKMKDGSVIEPDRLERPYVYTENGKPVTLSLAVKKGEESYNIHIPFDYPDIPVPNRRQLAWQQAELGVVFHYDLHVFDGKQYGQGNNRIDPVANYQIFNPEKLDTDQWVKAAKDAGATFAILTATHETGFALFQSEVNPYSLKALKWRNGQGDIVNDFVESCRKYDIKPGIYLGIRWNSFLGVSDFKINGEGPFQENRQKWYNRMVEGMVTEICTKYGELFEIWFDGGAGHPDNGAPDVLPIVRKYQPNCLFYHNGQLAEARWGGSESGTVGYPSWATFPYPATGGGEKVAKNIAKDNYKLLKQGDPNGKYWVPAMSDAPLRGYNGRHEWFWEPGDEAHVYPLEDLLDMYYKSVGRNSTLILGLTPDPDGLMPAPDVQRLKELGDELKKRFSDPIAQTSGKGNKLDMQLKKLQKVDQLVIQEDIAHGERIRQYRVEASIKKGWKVVARGRSVGHKRIQLLDKTIETSRLRLVVEESMGEPLIKNWSIHYIEQ